MMKALRFQEFGTPAVLALEEVARPEPGPGEVLVEVRAAAINPSDVKNVAGFFPATTLPRTPGRDFAGVIASGPRQGEEVWSSGPGMGMARDGVQAEFAVVAEAALARRPTNLSLEQAAGLGVPYLTAWAGLMRAAQVQAGETVLLIGAGGAVGQAAAQIARWKGARVLGTDRKGPVAGVQAQPAFAWGSAAFALLRLRRANPTASRWSAPPSPLRDRPSGATRSLPRDVLLTVESGELRQKVLEVTGGQGVEVVFDLVGGVMFETALGCLGHGGRQVAITSVGERRVSFDLVDFYHNESRLLGVDSNHFSAEEVGAMAKALVAGFEAGALQPPAIEVTPFAGAIAAYEKVAKGEARKKMVLRMGE